VDEGVSPGFVLEPRQTPNPVPRSGVNPAWRQTPRKQSLSSVQVATGKMPGPPVGNVDADVDELAPASMVEVPEIVEEAVFGVPSTQTPISVASAPAALTQIPRIIPSQSESVKHV